MGSIKQRKKKIKDKKRARKKQVYLSWNCLYLKFSITVNILCAPRNSFFFLLIKNYARVLHGPVWGTHWPDFIFKSTIGLISSYPLQWYIKHNGRKLFGIVSEQFKIRVCAWVFFLVKKASFTLHFHCPCLNHSLNRFYC